jgi:hypothetical protein
MKEAVAVTVAYFLDGLARLEKQFKVNFFIHPVVPPTYEMESLVDVSSDKLRPAWKQ